MRDSSLMTFLMTSGALKTWSRVWVTPSLQGDKPVAQELVVQCRIQHTAVITGLLSRYSRKELCESDISTNACIAKDDVAYILYWSAVPSGYCSGEVVLPV